jgi:hypothetical protein
LRNNFHDQKYSKERDLFAVIESISWDSEKEYLAKERKHAAGFNSALIISAVAVVSLGLLIYFKFKK